MKILHTADLHLGKSLHETSLAEQQENMLQQILDILKASSYSALIIAGDVYDRSIPQAECVKMFDDFLSTLHETCPKTAVFIIPGNHDSEERLSFGAKLFKSNNIFIGTDVKCLCEPVIITEHDEKIQIFMLPFLHLGALTVKNDDGKEKRLTSQSELATEASTRLKAALNPGIPSILIAHLFTAQGVSSSTERSFIGTAEKVQPELFNFFTYTALGHLHKFQCITDRMYYSGAPLPYAFDEADGKKFVLSVEIDCKTEGFPVKIEPVEILPLKPLHRLKGSFSQFMNSSVFDAYKNDYLEITLTGNEVVVSPMAQLQSKFPHLMNIKQESIEKTINKKKEETGIAGKNINTPEIIFQNFLNFKTFIQSETYNDEEILFKEILSENEAEI